MIKGSSEVAGASLNQDGAVPMSASASSKAQPPLGSSPRQNIRGHLLRVVVAALASMALITLGLLAWNMTSQRRLAEAEMGRTVQAIAAALDQQLLVTTAALQSLVSTMKENADPERLHRIAEDVMTNHPYWSHVILRDDTGKILFTTAISYGAPAAGTDAVIPWINTALLTGQPQVSNLLYGPIARAPVAVVFVPARGPDGRQYVLGAAVTAIKWEALLHEQRIPSGWVAGIIDRDGVIVARTRAAESSVGKLAPDWVREAIQTAPEGHASGPALEGEPLSLAFARSHVSGWTVAFAAPAKVFEAPMRRSLMLATTVCVLALGFASLLVLVYARRLSQAVVGLARVVDAMREPEAKLPPSPGIDLAELASVYESMQTTDAHLRRVEEERLTAMRELQHRVKNDLQAILSLIALESGQSNGAETHRILGELQGRVEALRLIHSRLYETSRVGTVELGGYLRELCTNAVALYGRSIAGEVTLRASVCEVYVDHNTAVSLGLIANEFVTNSTKHAFPEGAGTIMLDLDVPHPGSVCLTLTDNGIGIPEGQTRASGLQLIAMLAEQVGGEPQWTVGPGTQLRVMFLI
ncbi:sensor histidine kinase [Azospirillum sp. CT11-132]|uniref:sensor histidine kinase n=1 Tax=Azospirillum sp. CT11-132 TaxID=3396317 RepID=UPI0039A45852